MCRDHIFAGHLRVRPIRQHNVQNRQLSQLRFAHGSSMDEGPDERDMQDDRGVQIE